MITWTIFIAICANENMTSPLPADAADTVAVTTVMRRSVDLEHCMTAAVQLVAGSVGRLVKETVEVSHVDVRTSEYRNTRCPLH